MTSDEGPPAMRFLFRGCVAASSVSVLAFLVLWNTELALTTRGYCVVLFRVPFADKAFRVPDWMCGPIPLSIWAFWTLVAVGMWVALLVKRSGIRRIQV